MAERENEPHFGTVNFERRKHPRFSINLPVEYWPAKASKGSPTRTGDISEGGLLLYLPAEMDSGQDLRVRLFIDSGLDVMSIEGIVQVVWKDLNLGDKEDYRTGVKFVEISPQDNSNLRNFLKTLVDLKSQSKMAAPSGLLSSVVLSALGEPSIVPPKDPPDRG
jgi:c-di-GMP-binding flagellar brake protein YcgR